MLQNIPSFERLVHELTKLPGIGPKSAQRMAYHLLRTPLADTDALRDALRDVKSLIRECPRCFSYTEEDELCTICLDAKRTDEVLCVVEDPADIGRIESSGAFRGRYHVLHGAIAPLEGVSPEDLKIKPLIERLRPSTATAPLVREVILALDADLEGDTTVLYLAKILKELGISATRIAHGVPIGGDIDYIDYRTLGRALENRIQV